MSLQAEITHGQAPMHRGHSRQIIGSAVSGPEVVIPNNFWQWLMFFFIIGSMTLSYFQGLSRVMVAYGLALSFLFVIFLLYHRMKVQPEVLVYCLWVLWALGGLTNAIDRGVFMEGLTTVLQMATMIVVISGITSVQRNVSVLMAAIFVGGIIVALSGVYTGDMQSVDVRGTTRVEGLTGNANAFAYQQLFLIFAAFYFLGSRRKPLSRAMILAGITVAVVAIIFSGSRKGFLGVIAFVFFWWLFCRGRVLAKTPIKTYAILIILVCGTWYSANMIITGTHLGNRLEHLEDSGNMKRLELYKEGIEMIKNYPVFGVGLNNYMLRSSSGLYSHSDYIEVAANTGVVGFVLYFSFYLLLWLRLNRIREMIHDPRISYNIGLFKAAILTILLVALGRSNLTSKLTWIFLAGVLGYSWSLERIANKIIAVHKKRNTIKHHRPGREASPVTLFPSKGNSPQ